MSHNGFQFYLVYILFFLSVSHGWLFQDDDKKGGAEVTTDGNVITSSNQQDEESSSVGQPIKVIFINQASKAMDIYWDDGSYGVIVTTQLNTGGQAELSTYVGHTFHWNVHGRRQQVGVDVVITADKKEYILPADTKVTVDKNTCQDRHRRCKLDAQNGECIRNPGWMIVNCPVSCQKCDMLDMSKRCDRKLPHLNMSDVPTWQPGDLNKLFEDIMNNPLLYSKYNPKALSQPPDGPWVITFENMIEEDEADALVLSVSNQFERSTDTGEANELGEAQKLVSTGRTSENAWCVGQCYTNKKVMRLTERVENITKIPSGHYENFQVLRYRPGQFYRVHHDMSAADNAIPCGPRILTFFLYLSDVEEGGGTNFPRLDLTVQPKRGSAVLWPSVMDHDPTKQDPRTHHQALPVVKGTKFAANAWIHLYDYKMPNLWGCTGAFG
jgi:prolyl 4-hydroxylase